jgi:hypothetical protein
VRSLSLVSGFLVWFACLPSSAQMGSHESASACASCHAAQSVSQSRTPMGRALELPGSNPTLAAHPKLTARKGAFTYTVETHGDKSTYSVSDGAQTISFPIHWAFGEGAQTWVLERSGKFYESLVSYYPSISGLETTTGDESLTPHTLDEAMGRELTQSDTRDCFGCHASNTQSHGKLSVDSLEPGVTCEHCHAGAVGHLVDAFHGDYSSAPQSLHKLSSEHISSFCGQCHRTWEKVVMGGWRGEGDVRFQPFRLANSKCYDGADPRISCIACHDPHQDVVRQDSFYDSKCLACHAAPTHPATASPGDARVCPVAKSNCVSCHMPKVRLPDGLITFADHQIRIVKAGEPYPN